MLMTEEMTSRTPVRLCSAGLCLFFIESGHVTQNRRPADRPHHDDIDNTGNIIQGHSKILTCTHTESNELPASRSRRSYHERLQRRWCEEEEAPSWEIDE